MTTRKRFILWQVIDVKQDRADIDATSESRSLWRKIGEAFENRDGSISLDLDAIPLRGKLILREAKG